MDTVAWKAYEEVDFSDKYILRWVREGDEYVNKITKEMMEDLKSVVRQQQAEIEALKQIIDANNLSQNIGQFVKPTNEPVAYVDNVWINRPDLAMDLGIGQMFSRCQLSNHQIPLYTHPVKELTDEEWNKAFDFYCETDEGVLQFDLELRGEWKKEQLTRWKEALRKAQEK